MALGNQRIKNQIKYTTCLSTDIKLLTAQDGDEYYEVDSNETYVFHKGNYYLKSSNLNDGILNGVASEGSSTDLTDYSLNFASDAFVGKYIKIDVDNIPYIREIITNTANSFSFDTLGEETEAKAFLGDGLPAEGQTSITVAEGTGINYSVQFVAGTGESTPAKVQFNQLTGLLKIISPTDVSGTPIGLLAGQIQDIINTNDIAKELFTATIIVEAVALPYESEVLYFEDDEIIFGSGLPALGEVIIAFNDKGVFGNDYSVEVVSGDESTLSMEFTVNKDTKILTITIPLDIDGNPVNPSADGIATNLNADTVISQIFKAEIPVIDGVIPIGTTFHFAGGSDTTKVKSGTKYTIL